MKQLTIPYLPFAHKNKEPHIASSQLGKLGGHLIDAAPWPDFTYKPAVSFVIAYSNDSILLKYNVEESAVQAVHVNTNDPVHKDSCVEFFIAFGDEAAYYNFEFNCAGVCQAGFGCTKESRVLLTAKWINKIRHQLKMKTVNQAGCFQLQWELTLVIPFVTFCHHQIDSLNQKTCAVNFYKCGDDLPVPHYLCWNTIKSEIPNFHLPEFFGKAQFS